MTAINPTSTNAGSGATPVVVTGAGFVAGSTVQWSGVGLTTAYVSTTRLTATVPASALKTAGKFPVTVSNPSPGGGTSHSVIFTVNQTVNPAPTLASITLNATSNGYTITANGTNFVATSVVQWNGVNLVTTYNSATQLTGAVSGVTVTAGTVYITVFTPGLGGGTSGPLPLTITASSNAPPVITSISPGTTEVDSNATDVTLTGTNFNGPAYWNGVAVGTKFSSSTQATATIPASDLTKVGTFYITVVNSGAFGGTSNPMPFKVTPLSSPPPAVTSVSPDSASVGSTATPITVLGSNFVSGSAIQWNGSALPTTFASSTRLTAALPASDLATAGTYNITVFNSGTTGGTSNVLSFTVVKTAATLSSITPNTASAGSGSTPLMVTGTNFVPNSQALWDGTPLATSYISATNLAFLIPKGDLATAAIHKITVKNPDLGGLVSNAIAFAVR